MGFATGFSASTGAYRTGQHIYVDWGGAAVTSQLDYRNALTAIRENLDGTFTVVDGDINSPNYVVPDFFVFAVISSTNGFKAVQKLEFSYIPAAIDADSLSGISKVDFIHSISDVIDIENPSETFREDYTFSFVNFGYSLTDTQGIDILTTRLSDGTYRFDFDYVITDNSFFFLDFINIFQYDIDIFYDSSLIYSGNNQIIEVRLEHGLPPAITSRNLPSSNP